MTKEKQLVELVDALEGEMRKQGQWQQHSPSVEALSSQEPFAIDSLTPLEWLQWIFVARIRLLVKESQPLPTGFAMAAYFEECWKEEQGMTPLITILQQIDKVCRHA
ncbi:YqcC family protein [Vibrio hepatarius]|uniref:YqcC family protein n=1 Tax=Vibrio hepatarius TaxID=171383 RepID=UPI003736CB20